MVQRGSVVRGHGAGPVQKPYNTRTGKGASAVRGPPARASYLAGAARGRSLWATAEPASNAVAHGCLPGRDFRLTLRLLPHVFRVEVADTRPDAAPSLTVPPSADGTSGRGLLLVAAHAGRWGCTVHDAYAKTVWAEVRLPSV